MKIEKLNENQIRCTLTRADLADRQLKLSELAYGTEKAKSLFHDMIQQAAYEFGFEADDIPLMIEAIPASSDSIILIITKVEDPEELDARFSKFAPPPIDEVVGKSHEILEKLEGAEDFLDLINKVKSAIPTPEEAESHVSHTSDQKIIRLFKFATMDNVIYASHLLNSIYNGANTLYKDTVNDIYILAAAKSEHSIGEFNKICNMLSEYGSLEKTSSAGLAYLEEHCDVVISTNAVQQLSLVS